MDDNDDEERGRKLGVGVGVREPVSILKAQSVAEKQQHASRIKKIIKSPHSQARKPD